MKAKMDMSDWQESLKSKRRLESAPKSNKWSPSNPNPAAVARVLDHLAIPTKCWICSGDDIQCVNNATIYGKSYGKWPYAYLCMGCKSYVGLHPETNLPLGTLADQETRDARAACKPDFEKLFKTGKMSRTQAYTELAKYLGIEKSDCHFGWFDVELCLQAHEWALEKQLELGLR
jgi:hypothetical protein